MNQKPIWRQLQECAEKLTTTKQVPFTRAELFECVRKYIPSAVPDSVNPIIQGITDNLKGGAPGAEGKNILHSVGRGKFVLHSSKESYENHLHQSPPNLKSELTEGVPLGFTTRLPENEDELRNGLVVRLKKMLPEYDIKPEAKTSYSLPNGTELTHASDILVSKPGKQDKVSIEIKYKSAVTDQFKCRAYDALHIKQQHGDSLLTIMMFARAKKGIGIDRARSICYPFDRFYGNNVLNFLVEDGLDELVRDIREYFN